MASNWSPVIFRNAAFSLSRFSMGPFLSIHALVSTPGHARTSFFPHYTFSQRGSPVVRPWRAGRSNAFRSASTGSAAITHRMAAVPFEAAKGDLGNQPSNEPDGHVLVDRSGEPAGREGRADFALSRPTWTAPAKPSRLTACSLFNKR
jgi:hypothetical protein